MSEETENKRINRGKALAAMSGGVDSSVVAWLLQKAGYETVGATMLLVDTGAPAIQDARSVADRLGIRHLVYDLRDEFRREVIDRFVDAYEHGRTPNPCVTCNRQMKFGALYRLAAADLLNTEAGKCGSSDEPPLSIATGHYAVIEKLPSGRYALRKAQDAAKDQAYFLSALSQEQLSRTLFPLGTMTKPEVREIAESLGLVTARKKDSQDICFVPGGDYAAFIQSCTGKEYPPGDFIDANGHVLGEHRGIIHYTVGQRKGLGIALGAPAYVQALDAERNRVILGSNETLFTRELVVTNFNWVSIANPGKDFQASARIRYRHQEAPARIIPLAEDTVRVIFDEPQRAVTSGQTAVVYDGDYVLGGGTIL